MAPFQGTPGPSRDKAWSRPSAGSAGFYLGSCPLCGKLDASTHSLSAFIGVSIALCNILPGYVMRGDGYLDKGAPPAALRYPVRA